MILLDTHVLVWFLQADPSLGPATRIRIEAAMQTEGVGISAITPWEIAMLISKKRLSLGRPTENWVNGALSRDGVSLLPLEPEIAVEAGELGDLHGDPADRIIIATALHNDAPLLTADRTILDYGEAGHVRTIDASR